MRMIPYYIAYHPRSAVGPKKIPRDAALDCR